MTPDLIKKVAIVGGTHGNELIGVHLVKKWQHSPEILQRHSFECITLISNPSAVAANRRYIDRDLNRCFADEDLANSKLTSYEDRRAKEIAIQLGPKEQPLADVIIDLHTTTANMGLSLLPSSKHPFNLRLAAYLNAHDPNVKICFGLKHGQAAPMLRSLSPLGFTVEVGPIAQGVLNADLFLQTELLIHKILDYIDAINQGTKLTEPDSVNIYQAISSVDYPRNDTGELKAMVHPNLQFKDYEPLNPGQPMFLGFTGQEILYAGADIVYPVFINEAAYYEKQLAMVLTEKQQISLKNA
jgi:succinylglutamate desuccinylase